MNDYITLQSGDIRQDGDQVRNKVSHKQSLVHPADTKPDWRPCSLIGHEVLIADLINTELRRPIQ